MNTTKLTFIALIVLIFSVLTPTHKSYAAAVVVVAHPDNSNVLTVSDVQKIFLGKTLTFPDGTMAIPVDLPLHNETRSYFLKHILQKNQRALNHYWSRMLFSSRGRPPKILNNSEQVKMVVAANPNILGYIDEPALDSSVIVILRVYE